MNLILSRLDKSEKPMAVVKADAYGCGSQCVSKFLQKNFKIERLEILARQTSKDVCKYLFKLKN